MRERDRRRYLACIGNRHWLKLEESTVDGIPQGLQALDPDLFLVFNLKTGEFEVHDAAVPVKGLTRILAAEECDGRILARVRAASHDMDPIRAAEEWAAEEQASIARKAANDREAIAYDLADAFRYAEFGKTRFARS